MYTDSVGGVFIHCSLRYRLDSFISVRSLIKCFLLREVLPDHS